MSQTWSVFDVIGPVMVGPSSSHTAGAARIGYFTRIINGQKPKKVKLLLHGSFGKVYRGHQTDSAIVGGLLGLLPHSDKIKNALEIARKEGMEVSIKQSNLGDTVHPNSVLIMMGNEDGSSHSVRAKSIGGGKIVIREIDKVECQIDMSHSVLIVIFENKKLDALDLLLKIKNINGHIVHFDTSTYKDTSLLQVEILDQFSSVIIRQLENIKGIKLARFLNHISNYEHYS